MKFITALVLHISTNQVSVCRAYCCARMHSLGFLMLLAPISNG